NTLIVLEENSKIKLGGKYDGSLWYGLENVIYSSKDDVKSAFLRVIGSKRIRTLPPKERLTINVILNKQGKPSEVSYYLSEHTGLTIEELDRLSAYIKDHIIVKMVDVPSDKTATF